MILALLAGLGLLAAASLIGEAPWLTWVLPGGVAFGNLLVALGGLAWAWIPLHVNPGGTAFRWAGRLTVALALLWWPLGTFLAGNPNLNFHASGDESLLFQRYTIFAGTCVLTMLLCTLILAARAALLAREDRR